MSKLNTLVSELNKLNGFYGRLKIYSNINRDNTDSCFMSETLIPCSICVMDGPKKLNNLIKSLN